ncbi:MAG: hypothetical protein KDB00_03650 [Planctomycetales bacterium]|nr:hypothetical protein [Planctomycetales bacterium]
MFELEKAIHDWRHDLQQAGHFSEETIHELESHLRDGIAEFIEKGLTSKDAYTVAAARLGEHSALGAEFVKVNGTPTWQRRVLWMLIGYVGGIALTHAISGASSCVGTMPALLGLGGASSGVITVVTRAVCWTFILAALYFRARRSDMFHEDGNISLRWLTLLVAVFAIGGALTMVGRVIHSRVTPVAEFGESMMWTSIGGWAIQIYVAIAGVSLILAIRERLPSESTVS